MIFPDPSPTEAHSSDGCDEAPAAVAPNLIIHQVESSQRAIAASLALLREPVSSLLCSPKRPIKDPDRP